MRERLRHLLTWAALVVAVLLSPTALAATAAEARQFVKDQQVKLMDLVRKGANADVDRVFGDTLDYDAIARDSLGDDWNGLKAAQQQQFRCLLERLVARAYHRDLKRTLDYAITFEEKVEEVPGKGFLVKSVVKSRTNAREDPVSIAYVVQWNGERWRVRDIVTEGSSMGGSYEAQFRRLLKRKGFEELIRKMEEKLGAVESAACRDPRPAG